MAPGLITSLPQGEVQERHRDAPHSERVAASHTAPSSSQPSPVFHALEPDDQATGGADNMMLLDNRFVEQLKKTRAISKEQKRQLDKLLDTFQATANPRLIRAYSEGSLPPATTADGDPDTTPERERGVSRRETRYQATVEDCTESEDDEDTPTPSCTPTAPAPSKELKPDQDKPRRHHTFAASAPTSPSAAHASTTEASVPVAAPIIKEVRFSDRAPSVLQRSASARHVSWNGSTSQSPKSHTTRERILSLQDERWGTLFTPQGKATLRMRNVLRGLATHLTEVYKPTYSLVLTPEKLYKFYSKYRMERESVDLTRLFSHTSRSSMSNLEKLYLSLQCDFHLVQDNLPGPKKWPCIPALTPEGFVQWNVMLIRAYPDQEAARLARVFADVPLEAVPEDPSLEYDDQRARRLPRQISRHLFPSEPNPSELQLLTGAIRDWKQAAPGPDRPPPAQVVQNPPPPLIHSDARSRQEHLNRCRRDYESEAAVLVPQGSRRMGAEEREGRSSRYAKPHARPESPRRGSKRYERRDSKEFERDRRRGDRRWSADSYEESRYRRREPRGSRV
ncbi:hypothetical protein IF1G_00260 [Cordyceps javanica]|uniref:DUF7514 domain-containing protein n=1 Tax=Cordyceps javanica TaxID=43265 RepID=A0A545WC23_9HYPO|nr:hypothetical protein IF1G_00260 [Cordyceps javanica]TQW11518.1 hypothetical protein IF2G_00249 [Cordyceps javanica]